MAVWKWFYIHNVVSIGSHQFGEHWTRETVSVLVSSPFPILLYIHSDQRIPRRLCLLLRPFGTKWSVTACSQRGAAIFNIVFNAKMSVCVWASQRQNENSLCGMAQLNSIRVGTTETSHQMQMRNEIFYQFFCFSISFFVRCICFCYFVEPSVDELNVSTTKLHELCWCCCYCCACLCSISFPFSF